MFTDDSNKRRLPKPLRRPPKPLRRPPKPLRRPPKPLRRPPIPPRRLASHCGHLQILDFQIKNHCDTLVFYYKSLFLHCGTLRFHCDAGNPHVFAIQIHCDALIFHCNPLFYPETSAFSFASASAAASGCRVSRQTVVGASRSESVSAHQASPTRHATHPQPRIKSFLDRFPKGIAETSCRLCHREIVRSSRFSVLFPKTS
jgi:hypothetical protein